MDSLNLIMAPPPRDEEKPPLARLILIDGLNMMHHFNDMGFSNPAIADERMSPLVFVPLVYKLMQDGHIVRIVMRTTPETPKISDEYILKELQGNDLLLYPLTDDIEKDDVLLLDLARKYGAIILSRDYFRNHKGYEEVVQKYTIEYDKESTGHLRDRYSSEILRDELVFKYRVILHADADDLLAFPDQEDYELVEQSKMKFKPIQRGNILNLKLLFKYIYATYSYVYNYGVPECVSKFIKDGDFPMQYREFTTLYGKHLEKLRKSDGQLKAKKESEPLSEDEFPEELHEEANFEEANYEEADEF